MPFALCFLDARWAIVSGEAIESLYNISNRPETLFQTAPQELMNCVKKRRKYVILVLLMKAFGMRNNLESGRRKVAPSKPTNKIVKAN